MPVTKAARAGNSGAEEKFIQLFCDVFGPEKGQYVYLQYPFVDIYGKHRTIDYAFACADGRVAVEVDGTTWHDPSKVSEDKYTDDLLKQNSMVYEGWKVFRWTDRQLERSKERVKDELVTFFGSDPHLTLMDDDMPRQRGVVYDLKQHQKDALQNLCQMREDGNSIAMLYEATGTGKTVTAVSDAKNFGKRVLFLAHTKELVYQAYEKFKEIWPEVSVGRFVENHRELDAFVLCASIQSIEKNLLKLRSLIDRHCTLYSCE